MKQLNKRELCAALKKAGFELVRNNKHEIWSNGDVSISVPVHKINFKLATKIINQCNLVL